VVAICFVIDLLDLGGAKEIKALGVPAERCRRLGDIEAAAAGFRFGGGFWRRARFF
jgi:hypothetical protein